jgi:hypothetical protein
LLETIIGTKLLNTAADIEPNAVVESIQLMLAEQSTLLQYQDEALLIFIDTLRKLCCRENIFFQAVELIRLTIHLLNTSEKKYIKELAQNYFDRLFQTHTSTQTTLQIKQTVGEIAPKFSIDTHFDSSESKKRSLDTGKNILSKLFPPIEEHRAKRVTTSNANQDSPRVPAKPKIATLSLGS